MAIRGQDKLGANTLANNPSKVALVYKSVYMSVDNYYFNGCYCVVAKINRVFLFMRDLCYYSDQTASQADHFLVFYH